MELDKVFSCKKVEAEGEVKLLSLWHTDSNCLLEDSEEIIRKYGDDFKDYFDDALIDLCAHRLAEATFKKVVEDLMGELGVEVYTVRTFIVENHCFFVLTINYLNIGIERKSNNEV